MEKYSDGYDPKRKEHGSHDNPIVKILAFIMQFGFGILIGAICIIVLPAIIIWLVGCIIFKKEPTLRLTNWKKNKPLKDTSNGE